MDEARVKLRSAGEIGTGFVHSAYERTLVPTEDARARILAFAATDVGLAERVRRDAASRIVAMRTEEGRSVVEVTSLVERAVQEHTDIAITFAREPARETERLAREVIERTEGAVTKGMRSVNDEIAAFLANPLTYLGEGIRGILNEVVIAPITRMIANAVTQMIEGEMDRFITELDSLVETAAEAEAIT